MKIVVCGSRFAVSFQWPREAWKISTRGVIVRLRYEVESGAGTGVGERVSCGVVVSSGIAAVD